MAEKVTISQDEYLAYLEAKAELDALRADMNLFKSDFLQVAENLGFAEFLEVEGKDEKQLKAMKKKMVGKVAAMIPQIMMGSLDFNEVVPATLIQTLKRLYNETTRG